MPDLAVDERRVDDQQVVRAAPLLERLRRVVVEEAEGRGAADGARILRPALVKLEQCRAALESGVFSSAVVQPSADDMGRPRCCSFGYAVAD